MAAILGFTSTPQTDPMILPKVLIYIAVVFVSILWHELGHALFMRRYGANAEIVLHGMGGYAIPDRNPGSRFKEFMITLMGPGFGLLLGGAVWLLAKFTPVENSEVGWFTIRALLFVNIGWSLMNLLPVLPMDGGRIMETLLGRRRKALACQIGLLVSIGLVVWGVMTRNYFMALLFGSFGYSNYQTLQHLKPQPDSRRPGNDSRVIRRNDEDPDWWKRG
jgi:Zn-dependent protease